jgi:hypothetical protein
MNSYRMKDSPWGAGAGHPGPAYFSCSLALCPSNTSTRIHSHLKNKYKNYYTEFFCNNKLPRKILKSRFRIFPLPLLHGMRNATEKAMLKKKHCEKPENRSFVLFLIILLHNSSKEPKQTRRLSR